MWQVLVLEGKKGGGESQVMEGVPSARGHHHMRHRWANGSGGKRSPLVGRVDPSGYKGGGLGKGPAPKGSSQRLPVPPLPEKLAACIPFPSSDPEQAQFLPSPDV